MARWAGEGNDWIKLRNLLEFLKHALGRDLPPFELGITEAGKWPTLEIKRNCKTIADWVNGHAKMKTRVPTVEKAQNLLREWWGRGIRFRWRTAEWITHTFREHNTEADLWADKGAKGRVEEWVDTTRIEWQEVTSLCGFCDGSCDNCNCGRRHCDCGLFGRNTDGPLPTRSVDRYWVFTPWMLSWEGVVC